MPVANAGGIVSPLTAHVGFWLRFVSNHVSQAFALKVAEHGVSVAEWVILRELYEAGSRAPSDLADRTGMTRGAISKIVDRLAAKDLVTRAAGQDDRRRRSVAITNAGLALVPKLAALADANDAEFFDGLTAAERQEIIRTMKKIVDQRELRAVPVE
jgi:DNA-binding MarR family transcriptional regulator